MPTELAAQIKAARLAAGLDRATAAKRMRIGSAYLGIIERRADVPPKLARLAALVYGCDEGTFYIIKPVETENAACGAADSSAASSVSSGASSAAAAESTAPSVDATSRSDNNDRGSGLRGQNIVTQSVGHRSTRRAAGTAAFQRFHSNRRNQ